jgi:hypothetical protein
MSKSIFGNVTQTNDVSNGGIINGPLQIDDNLIAETVEVGLVGQRYSLPTTKGLATQVITRSSIDDSTSWETPQSFDQDLHTDSNTQFQNCKLSVNDDILSPTLTFHKTRGDFFNQETVEQDDVVGSIKYQGRNIGGFTQLCAKVEVSATEDFLIGQNGTSLKIYTVDNATTALKEQLKIDSSGVTINQPADSITFPQTRGTNAQVLTSNGAGLAQWVTPSPTNPFNQTLNKADNVRFNAVLIGGVWFFENASNFLSIESVNKGMGFNFGYGSAIYYGVTNASLTGGFELVTETSRGNIDNRTSTESGDGLTTFTHRGQGDTVPVPGATIKSIANQNFTDSNAGSRMEFSTSELNTIVPVLKMKLDDDGVTINQLADSINFPQNRGTNAQVLTSNGAGLAEWKYTSNPFDQSLNTIDGVEHKSVDIKISSNSLEPILRFDRTLGTAAVPLPITGGVVISDIKMRGLSDTGFYTNAASIAVISEQNFTSTQNGSRMTFSVTDTGSVDMTQKLMLNNQGVTINHFSDSINFPQTRGINSQVLTSNGSGLAEWKYTSNPFDQGLNVDDDVNFANVQINSKWNISNNGGQTLVFSNDDNEYQFFLQNGAMRSTRSSGTSSANTLSLMKSRGSLSSPNNTNNGDQIGNIEHRSYDDSSFGICVETMTRATENHSPGNHGAEWKLLMCDNGSDVLIDKIVADTEGITINAAGNRFRFPNAQGNIGEVLTSNGNGLAQWVTPFIPYNYNYDSSVHSTVMTSADGLITITDGIKQTSLVVVEPGTYLLKFNGIFDLAGNIPQQLTTKAQEIANTLTGLTYTTIAGALTSGAPANTVYSAGNYYYNGARTFTGNLECAGNATDVFVFYVNGALDMAASTSIVLSGGALAKNVFFVCDGAFSTAGDAIFRGQLFAGTAITFPGISVIEGRIISLGGAVTIGSSWTPSQTPDTSSLLGFGVLANYIIYTVSGAVSKTSNIPAFSGDILTGAGNVSGFGAPYDGSYSSGVTVPKFRADMGFYLDGVYIPTSSRCIRSDLTSCYNQTMCARATITANQVVSVRGEVLLGNTSMKAKDRILNVNRVYF